MLTPDTEAPIVPQTTVSTDLLQPLKVITKLGIDAVGQDLGVLAIDNILLPVKEPGGDPELRRVLDYSDDTLEFIRVEFTSSGIRVSVRVRGNGFVRTASSGRYRPSCRQCWHIVDQHHEFRSGQGQPSAFRPR